MMKTTDLDDAVNLSDDDLLGGAATAPVQALGAVFDGLDDGTRRQLVGKLRKLDDEYLTQRTRLLANVERYKLVYEAVRTAESRWTTHAFADCKFCARERDGRCTLERKLSKEADDLQLRLDTMLKTLGLR